MNSRSGGNRGYFVSYTNRYLNGINAADKADFDSVEDTNRFWTLNPDFSIARVFKSSWGNPHGNADVSAYAADGTAVAWSVKPPAWSGTCGTWTSGGGCPNGGTSPWDRAEADQTDTTSMRSMIRQLQDDANLTGGPSFMTITISHEPHDDAIDDKGWNFGQGDDGSDGKPVDDIKCGSPSDPSLDYDSNNDGDLSDKDDRKACLGTSADFKAMYQALEDIRNNSCTSTGATTGLGSPCSKVLIQYIGVVGNMTTSGAYGVGSGDKMAPVDRDGSGNITDTDFDVLGADPYNYGCFDNSSGCTGDGGWESFEDTVDKPSSSTSLLDLASVYNKKVLLDEVGSHPGCSGLTTDPNNNCAGSSTYTTRSKWMIDAHNYLATDFEANKYIMGWIYYHTVKTHDWRFLDYYDGATYVNPDANLGQRGRSEYQRFVLDNTAGYRGTTFLTTANGYTVNLTP